MGGPANTTINELARKVAEHAAMCGRGSAPRPNSQTEELVHTAS